MRKERPRPEEQPVIRIVRLVEDIVGFGLGGI